MGRTILKKPELFLISELFLVWRRAGSWLGFVPQPYFPPVFGVTLWGILVPVRVIAQPGLPVATAKTFPSRLTTGCPLFFRGVPVAVRRRSALLFGVGQKKPGLV